MTIPETTKSQRGGPRPGSGRKPLYGQPMVQIKLGLPMGLIDLLDQATTSQQTSRSAVARAIIETWAKQQTTAQEVSGRI